MITRVPASALRAARWDARYWDPRFSRPLDGLDPSFPVRPLGEHVALLAYGPIITGSKPEPVADGTLVVTGTAFAPAGLDLSLAVRVRPGCEFDPVRTRLRPGDLLLPRSGAGSLGRGRMGVWEEPVPANVGCFVDLVRLQGLNPWYLWAFLRCRFGWMQVARLVNGVAQPNLSFAEVRGLEVAVPPGREQDAVEGRFRLRVQPAHRRYMEAPPSERRDAAREAEAALRTWFEEVERWLEGGPPLPEPEGPVEAPAPLSAAAGRN